MGYENPRSILAGLTRELAYEEAKGRADRVKAIKAEIRKVKAVLGKTSEPERAVDGESVETASPKPRRKPGPNGGAS